MKRFLKALLWITGAAGLVLLVLFLGAMFERQGELAQMTDEEKAELRQQLVDGELGSGGAADDTSPESGARSTVADIVARVKSPTVLRYGGIALGVVLLAGLGVNLLRYRRTLTERKRKQTAEDQLDRALEKIEADIVGTEPGVTPAKKTPFWARWTRKKAPAISTADADLMPWETEDSDEAPSSGGDGAVGPPTPSVELESYSARGRPSKTIDRPAEKMLAAGLTMASSDPGAEDRPKTPDPIPAAATPRSPAGSSPEAARSGGGGFRPRDLETAQRLLSKHMTACIGRSGSNIGRDRTSHLVAVAEAAVRTRPMLDQPRRAHLPIEVRLAIRVAEEIGRQSRPGEDDDLAQVMVDVVIGLQEEG